MTQLEIEIPVFSIIIPIYNVEPYLRQCIESVLNQTFRNIEVILVNDGSTDGCPEICDEYSQKDSRIKVIHKENGGASDARNSGVQLAKGEYLLFIDSDDWLNGCECFSKIAKVLAVNKSIDILEYEINNYHKNKFVTHKVYNDFMNTLSPEESLFYNIKNDLVSVSACSKAIKRTFFTKNNLFFIKGIKSEDTEWYLRIMALLPNYFFLHEQIYIYRAKREGSVTRSIDYNHLSQYYDFLAKHTKIETNNQKLDYCILSYIAYHYTILCGLSVRCSGNEKKKLMSKLRDMKSILKYDLHPKVRKTKKVMKLLGFNFTVYLLNMFIKHIK